MRRTYMSFLASLLALAVTSSDLRALANRVFVSARSGNDANACGNVATPCQTFAGTVAQVNAGGEVIVLDSGGYGPVTITKSLTIEAPPGVTAFIHPPSGDAVTINAGAGDRVILRGLVLSGGSSFGLIVISVGALHVENCVISGFSQDGIFVQANAFVFIKDTISRANDDGLFLADGRVSVDHCRFEDNLGVGVFADGADVTVRDSVSSGNFVGFKAQTSGTENTILQVYESLSTNNRGDGFAAAVSGSGGGFVNARVANSSVSENVGVGLDNLGGATFESLGNNFVSGNVGGDVSAGITIIGAH